MHCPDLNYIHNSRLMVKGLFVILTTLISVIAANGQGNTPKYSNEFLNIGVDARAFGMGMSMVSHVGDVSAGYWNPAGLTHLDSDYQLELMHSAYFGGIANYDYGAFAAKLKDKSVLGVSVLRFAVDDIADTRLLFDANGGINYDNIQYFSAADYGFLVSYAKELAVFDGMQVGGSLKVIHRIVGDFADSWGFGVDFGVQKKWESWQFGLMARDVFGTFNSWSINDNELAEVYQQTGNELYTQSLEITLPRVIIGAARTVQIGDNFTLLSALDLTLTTDGQRNTLVKSDIVSLDPSFGLEAGYKNIAFIRGGVGQFQQVKDFDGSKEWTFQPNIGVGFKVQEMSIDYAFTDIGDQAAGLYSHVFSVKVNFNVEN